MLSRSGSSAGAGTRTGTGAGTGTRTGTRTGAERSWGRAVMGQSGHGARGVMGLGESDHLTGAKRPSDEGSSLRGKPLKGREKVSLRFHFARSFDPPGSTDRSPGSSFLRGSDHRVPATRHPSSSRGHQTRHRWNLCAYCMELHSAQWGVFSIQHKRKPFSARA
jgi:hypothetical protein